jgi:adenosine deaminase
MKRDTRMTREALIRRLPKVELHLHLEGTLEPELAFSLAERNGVQLPYASAEQMRDAYRFADLQSFLDVYYAACSVLRTEQDFFDLTWAYLQRADSDNVRHVEPFFDPQTHTARGIPYATVLDGITRALTRGRIELGITSRLIACFLRDLTAHDARVTLDEVLRHTRVDGVGLDSGEVGHPPEKFAEVFQRAQAAGLHAVAHAGEEGPPSYITGALDDLKVERIDHGVRCLEDPALVARLVRQRICLTVCPLSNVALRVYDRMEDHPLKRMLDAGLRATVNSDDPAYFGGYIHENYVEVARALDLSEQQLVTLARNAIEGSFARPARKDELLAELDFARR